MKNINIACVAAFAAGYNLCASFVYWTNGIKPVPAWDHLWVGLLNVFIAIFILYDYRRSQKATQADEK